MAYNWLTKRDAKFYSEKQGIEERYRTIMRRACNIFIVAVGMVSYLWVNSPVSPEEESRRAREIKSPPSGLSARGRAMIDYVANNETRTMRRGNYNLTTKADSILCVIEAKSVSGVFMSGVREEDGTLIPSPVNLEKVLAEAGSYQLGKPINSVALQLSFCRNVVKGWHEARRVKPNKLF